jgi:hypothetical protein
MRYPVFLQQRTYTQTETFPDDIRDWIRRTKVDSFQEVSYCPDHNDSNSRTKCGTFR